MDTIFDIQGFGEQVLTLRKDSGLSQSELARMAGVSRAFVSGLENGQMHDPGMKKILRVLKVLGKGLKIVSFGPPSLEDLLAEQGLLHD